MKVADFDFDLPAERIADRPAAPRDSARLLCVGSNGLADRCIRDLPDLLRPHDLLIGNDTRVIPARLSGKRGMAGIEITLHKRLDRVRWLAFARPAKKLKSGDEIIFAPDFGAVVLEKHDGGEVLLSFAAQDGDLMSALERHGRPPLPPYIKRASDSQDKDDYQTLFARNPGAVAAPTAGLHFTPDLLAALAARNIHSATVTLHVGAGTFLPVKVEDTQDHKMHSEWGQVSAKTAALVAETRAKGGRIVAIGTTSLRILESASGHDGLNPFEGETDIFIVPGYRFRLVDVLLTNFHLPRSTLFMLVSAFSGLDRMQAAYRHAIDHNYRFYSYGDACLLECAL